MLIDASLRRPGLGGDSRRRQMALLVAISVVIVIIAALAWWGGPGPERKEEHGKLPYFFEARLLDGTISSDENTKLMVKVKNPGENYYGEGVVKVRVTNETPDIYISRGENMYENSAIYTLPMGFESGDVSGSYHFWLSGGLPKGAVSQTVEIKVQVLVEETVTDERTLYLTIKRPE